MGWCQEVCTKLSAGWRCLGPQPPLTARLMHQSQGALPPSLLQGLSGLWGAWDTHTPFLPLQLFPLIHWALTLSPFLEASSPLRPRGPLGPPAGAHPFPVPPQPRLHSLAVESFSQDGRLLLPPRRAKKAQSECGGEGWALRLPRGEVTWPQSHNHRTSLGQLGTLRNPGN